MNNSLPFDFTVDGQQKRYSNNQPKKITYLLI